MHTEWVQHLNDFFSGSSFLKNRPFLNRVAMLLIAKGPSAADGWQRAIPPAGTIVLGRNEEIWNAPWEPFLGRQHVELTCKIYRLKVRRLAAAANPVFHAGKQSDSFEL